MTSQTGQEIFKIYTLPNISKSKGNQTMKFGQLIWPEYKMRNIFLEKSYTRRGGEDSPKPFYEKSKCYKFYFMSKSRSTKRYYKLRC